MPETGMKIKYILLIINHSITITEEKCLTDMRPEECVGGS